MAAPIDRIIQEVAESKGWLPGTSLETRVALFLSRFGFRPDEVKQEHKVGRFRLDFAWPELRVGLEADGWQHQSPEVALKDRQREVELRRLGWVLLRVDDGTDSELEAQLSRAAWVIRGCQRMVASGHRRYRTVLSESELEAQRPPNVHVLGGRMGANRRWAEDTERQAGTAKARAALQARFDAAPDPVAAKRAFYAELALKRFQKRGKAA